MNGRNAQHHYLTAWAASDSDNFEEALHHIEHAIAIDCANPQFFAAQGHFLLSLKRYDEARASALHSLKLDPDNPHGLVLLGLVAVEEGQLTTALRSFQRAAELAPLAPTLTLLAAVQLVADPQAALQSARRALAIDPSWEEASNIVAKATNRLKGQNDDKCHE